MYQSHHKIGANSRYVLRSTTLVPLYELIRSLIQCFARGFERKPQMDIRRKVILSCHDRTDEVYCLYCVFIPLSLVLHKYPQHIQIVLQTRSLISFSYRTADGDKLRSLRHTRISSGGQALFQVRDKVQGGRCLGSAAICKVMVTCRLWQEFKSVNGIQGKVVIMWSSGQRTPVLPEFAVVLLGG